jgi:hypothetical protein
MKKELVRLALSARWYKGAGQRLVVRWAVERGSRGWMWVGLQSVMICAWAEVGSGAAASRRASAARAPASSVLSVVTPVAHPR